MVFLPERFILTSGVSENFARGLKDEEDRDLLVGAIQDAVFTELYVRYGIDESIARKIAHGIQRSTMDYRREFSGSAAWFAPQGERPNVVVPLRDATGEPVRFAARGIVDARDWEFVPGSFGQIRHKRNHSIFSDQSPDGTFAVPSGGMMQEGDQRIPEDRQTLVHLIQVDLKELDYSIWTLAYDFEKPGDGIEITQSLPGGFESPITEVVASRDATPQEVIRAVLDWLPTRIREPFEDRVRQRAPHLLVESQGPTPRPVSGGLGDEDAAKTEAAGGISSGGMRKEEKQATKALEWGDLFGVFQQINNPRGTNGKLFDFTHRVGESKVSIHLHEQILIQGEMIETWQAIGPINASAEAIVKAVLEKTELPESIRQPFIDLAKAKAPHLLAQADQSSATLHPVSGGLGDEDAAATEATGPIQGGNRSLNLQEQREAMLDLFRNDLASITEKAVVIHTIGSRQGADISVGRYRIVIAMDPQVSPRQMTQTVVDYLPEPVRQSFVEAVRQKAPFLLEHRDGIRDADTRVTEAGRVDSEQERIPESQATMQRLRKGTLLAGFEDFMIFHRNGDIPAGGISAQHFSALSGAPISTAQDELRGLSDPGVGLLVRSQPKGGGPYFYTLAPEIARAVDTDPDSLLARIEELTALNIPRLPREDDTDEQNLNRRAAAIAAARKVKEDALATAQQNEFIFAEQEGSTARGVEFLQMGTIQRDAQDLWARPFDSRHGLWPWTRSGFRPTGESGGATGSARGAPLQSLSIPPSVSGGMSDEDALATEQARATEQVAARQESFKRRGDWQTVFDLVTRHALPLTEGSVKWGLLPAGSGLHVSYGKLPEGEPFQGMFQLTVEAGEDVAPEDILREVIAKLSEEDGARFTQIVQRQAPHLLAQITVEKTPRRGTLIVALTDLVELISANDILPHEGVSVSRFTKLLQKKYKTSDATSRRELNGLADLGFLRRVDRDKNNRFSYRYLPRPWFVAAIRKDLKRLVEHISKLNGLDIPELPPRGSERIRDRQHREAAFADAQALRDALSQPDFTPEDSEEKNSGVSAQDSGTLSALANLPMDEQVKALGLDPQDPMISSALLAGQFGEVLDYTLTQDEAREAANTNQHRWVVIHSSVLTNSPAAAVALRRIQDDIAHSLDRGPSALHCILAVEGAANPEEAEAKALAMIAELPEASNQAVRLTRNDFSMIVPAAMDPDELVGRIQSLGSSFPGSRIASIVGPQGFAQAIQETSRGTEQPQADVIALEPAGSGQLTSNVQAIVLAVKRALTPTLVSQEHLRALLSQQLAEGLFQVKARPMTAQMRSRIRARQEAMSKV